ncbi:carbamoyltransferase C-terminal domain-containing protein [Spirochaetota bacterium]
MDNGKYFIGICIGHNATVSVIRNGVVLDAISEERFRNIKNYDGFPSETLGYFREKYALSEKNIARVTTNFKYLGPQMLSDRRQKASLQFLLRKLIRIAGYYIPFISILEFALYKKYMKIFGTHYAKRQRRTIADFLNIDMAKVSSCEHHAAHAYSAYFGSPFRDEEVLVLTLDGEGDFLAGSVNIARDNTLHRIAEIPMTYSVGIVYNKLTRHLGMKPLEHEYKIMGLAPYAKPEYYMPLYDRIKKLLFIDTRNRVLMKGKFNTHMIDLWMKKNLHEARFDNIAGAFQKLTENLMIKWIKNCIDETKIKKVAVAGGVFMNVKANKLILEIDGIEDLFIFPSPGDESTPIGAAMYSYISDTGKLPAPVTHNYWGVEYSNEDIKSFLDVERIHEKYTVEYHDDIAAIIAGLISQDRIVAVMQGRMEFGARSLGNRSILSNPSNRNIIEKLNNAIKGRDFWMPFAGAILEERALDYIINPKKHFSPYMVNAFDTTELGKKEFAAAIHPYDKTIRPQMVRKAWNPKFHAILREFEKKTGIGGVLNTSFNLHGYPIVLGPKEAIWVFENSELDYLALENYLIKK